MSMPWDVSVNSIFLVILHLCHFFLFSEPRDWTHDLQVDSSQKLLSLTLIFQRDNQKCFNEP